MGRYGARGNALGDEPAAAEEPVGRQERKDQREEYPAGGKRPAALDGLEDLQVGAREFLEKVAETIHRAEGAAARLSGPAQRIVVRQERRHFEILLPKDELGFGGLEPAGDGGLDLEAVGSRMGGEEVGLPFAFAKATADRFARAGGDEGDVADQTGGHREAKSRHVVGRASIDGRADGRGVVGIGEMVAETVGEDRQVGASGWCRSSDLAPSRIECEHSTFSGLRYNLMF